MPASGTAVLLSVLKALSDLRVESGSLNLMALDLNRRVIAFQQDGIQQLDWPALLEAVKKNNEPTISASALGGQHQNAAFFREVLETKLAGDLPVAPITGCSRSADAKPIRVIIVLSEAMIFAPGSDLKPLAANSDCNCRVFHLRYLRTAISAFDELDRIIKPLKPQRFEITTPLDLRRALRKILDEIGKL